MTLNKNSWMWTDVDDHTWLNEGVSFFRSDVCLQMLFMFLIIHLAVLGRFVFRSCSNTRPATLQQLGRWSGLFQPNSSHVPSDHQPWFITCTQWHTFIHVMAVKGYSFGGFLHCGVAAVRLRRLHGAVTGRTCRRGDVWLIAGDVWVELTLWSTPEGLGSDRWGESNEHIRSHVYAESHQAEMQGNNRALCVKPHHNSLLRLVTSIFLCLVSLMHQWQVKTKLDLELVPSPLWNTLISLGTRPAREHEQLYLSSTITTRLSESVRRWWDLQL